MLHLPTPALATGGHCPMRLMPGLLPPGLRGPLGFVAHPIGERQERGVDQPEAR